MKSIAKTMRKAVRHRRHTELRALLAEIVQSSDDAIFSRKLDGTISSWNHAAERIFGYQADQVIGKPSSLLLPPDRCDETNHLLKQIRRGERVEHFETVRVCKDGRRLTVSLTLSPIRNLNGRVTGASTIARDVTAQRELERQLVESGERERRRLGQDLHDGLGQQLSGIELMCRALARSVSRRSPADALTAELLVSQIQEATKQTRALARGLTPVMETPNGLMLALEEFATTSGALFRVNCRFLCEEPVLMHEHKAAVYLFRIAQEAVSNAVRHGRARRVDITLGSRNASLSLEIRDYGRGLPTPRVRGTGIGLRIMKYRAAALGGTLQLINAAPKGLLVSCIVPMPHKEALLPEQ